MQQNLNNFDKSIVVPFSTIDWPGRASMVVFLRGCNFKCCYCQNYRIWGAALPIDSDALLGEIQRNKDYVSALVFSGGEPTLRLNLLQLLAREAKNEGLLVGIETNGSFPEVLDTLIAAQLLDGLFVDLKAPLSNPQKYARIIGIGNASTHVDKIKRAIDIGCEAVAAKRLVEFELRTTLFKGLLSQDEILEMVNEFKTVPYALQQGRAEMCARKDLTTLTRDEIAKLAAQCRRPLRIRTLEKGDEDIAQRKFSIRGDDLLVIGFVGFPGSGKSEATAIAQAEGFFPIVMGDAVRSYMRQRNIELSEKNVGIIANKLRAEHGMDAIAKMCIPAVRSLTSQKVVIDGLRGIAEANAYRREFERDFKLIAISASPEVRFERVKGRSRPDDPRSFKRFEEKDERELAWGLEEALSAAEHSIQNEGTLQELKSAVSSLLERLGELVPRNNISISIRTPIHETEAQEKVERAIRNIFPDATLERANNYIKGTSSTLETFATLLKKQQIRATAKAELMKGLTLDSFEFTLNKQVALAGKVNFSQDPLGPIFVRVAAPLPEELIDAITNESLK